WHCRFWARARRGVSGCFARRSVGVLGGDRIGASSLSPRGLGQLSSVGECGGGILGAGGVVSHLEYSSGKQKRGSGQAEIQRILPLAEKHVSAPTPGCANRFRSAGVPPALGTVCGAAAAGGTPALRNRRTHPNPGRAPNLLAFAAGPRYNTFSAP